MSNGMLILFAGPDSSHVPMPGPISIPTSLPSRISHVVWDWNGTLLDDAWLCVEVMSALLDRHGLPLIDLERYARIFRFPVVDYYRELGFDFEVTPFEIVGTEFIEGYAEAEHRCGLREGAMGAIDGVFSLGLTQSVLSASEKRRLVSQATRLGVADYFDSLVALDDHYAGSKVEVGRLWLEESGLQPSRVLMVGDTDHDAEVARCLGVGCVLVFSGHQCRDRLAATGLPVLDSISQIVEGLGRAA